MSLIVKAIAQLLARNVGSYIGGHLVPIGTSLLVPVAAATALAMPPSLVEKIAAPVLGAHQARDASDELAPATVDEPYLQRLDVGTSRSFPFALPVASPTGLQTSTAQPADPVDEQQPPDVSPEPVPEDVPVADQLAEPVSVPTDVVSLGAENTEDAPPTEASAASQPGTPSQSSEPSDDAPPPPAVAPEAKKPAEIADDPGAPDDEPETPQSDHESAIGADEPAEAPVADPAADDLPAPSPAPQAPASTDALGSRQDSSSEETVSPADGTADPDDSSTATGDPVGSESRVDVEAPDTRTAQSSDQGTEDTRSAEGDSGSVDSANTTDGNGDGETGDNVGEDAGEPTDAGTGEIVEPGDPVEETLDPADQAGDESDSGEPSDAAEEDDAVPTEENGDDQHGAVGDESSDEGSDVEDPTDDSDPRNDRCLRPREAISTSHRPWWTLGSCRLDAHGHWLWIWIVDWLEEHGWRDEH